MKISFKGKQILELTEAQKNVIKNDIPASIFEDDMTRRCQHWLQVLAEKHAHKNRQKFTRELIANGDTTIPTNLIALAERYGDVHPPPGGFGGISPIIGQVGIQTFSFSANHQKVWRRASGFQTGDEARETKFYEGRMTWILIHKYEKCLERLKNEWLPKLEAKGIAKVPADDEAFALLVFSQPDYKDRAARDLEVQL